ncbi:uncharacterized protein [Miscanthus floridulus]|uniref:uncharacterized protein n=1 Tax=Miscanthus floridulus TaxID=154761 RepID=UPI00345A261E
MPSTSIGNASSVQTIGCRWDADGYVLCPEHVSNALPCDKLGTHTKENCNASSLHQSRRADNEGNFDYHNRENQQTDQLNTSNASSLTQSHPCHEEGISTNCSRVGEQTDQLNSSPYIEKEETFDSHGRKNQQTDHLTTSSPYLPHSLHSQKEISTNSSRDDQQIDQLHISSSSSLPLGYHSYDKEISKNRERYDQQRHKSNTSNVSLPQSCHPDIEEISRACQGEEMESDQHDTSSCPSDQLVLLGFSLSVEEKDFVQKFACWTKATLTEEWAENVTHVVLGKGAGSSWSRSFEVLMAILLGKWVVHFEWVADCLQLAPGPEASYEVAASAMDSLGAIDGPKQGRIRASEGAPKLFSGLCFCLSDFMSPDKRDRMRDLIAAAGGRMLEKRDLRLLLKNPDRSSSSVKPTKPCYFVYDVDPPRQFSAGSLQEEMEEVREQAAAGAQVICHLTVLDAVAAYDAQILLTVKKDRFVMS